MGRGASQVIRSVDILDQRVEKDDDHPKELEQEALRSQI